MADYTATTDMTLETAIANGSMGNGDNLTIDNGAVVTCDQTPSILLGYITVDNGQLLIDGANATDPIYFGQLYTQDIRVHERGIFKTTLGWYSIGTTDGTDSQVISNLDDYFGNTRVCGFSGIWIETGRRIDFNNASGPMPEVNDYVNKSGDKDLFGLITEVGADYLIVRYLLGTLADNDGIEVWKVVDNQGPEYKKSWTATVNNASGDVKAPGVYQEFANVYANGASNIDRFGHKSSGFVFEMQFQASTLTLGSSTGGGFVPPAGCDIRVPMITATCFQQTDYDNNVASYGTASGSSCNRIICSEGAIIDISGVNRYYNSWFDFFRDYPQTVAVSYCSAYRKYSVSFASGSVTLQHLICCANPVNDTGDSTMLSITASKQGIISDCLVVSPATRHPVGTIFYVSHLSNVTYKNIIEVLNHTGTTSVGTLSSAKNILIENFITHGRYPRFSLYDDCNNITFKNIKVSNSIKGDTAETSNGSVFSLSKSGNSSIKIQNIENIEGSRQTQRLINDDGIVQDIVVRAIGTPQHPLQMNLTDNAIRGYLTQSSIARCYFSGAGSSYGWLWSYQTDDIKQDLSLINCGDLDYQRKYLRSINDMIIRGMYGCAGAPGSSTGLQLAAYNPGLHFMDLFRSTTLGAIILLLNKNTTKNNGLTVLAGDPFFHSGQIDFNNGDSVEYESNYSALGHISFTGDYTTCRGTSASEHADEASALTIEFQYDTGSGWNGSWLDIRTALNLTSIPDFRTGIKLKMRLTATANVSGFSGVFLDTVTSDTARTDNLYPIDQAWVPVKITALDVYDSTPIHGAMVLLETDTGGPAPSGEEIIKALTGADGSITNDQYLFSADQPVTGRIRKASAPPFYKTAKISGTITANGLDLKIFMIRD